MWEHSYILIIYYCFHFISIGKNAEDHDLWVLEIGVQYGEQDNFIPAVRLLAGLSSFDAVNTEVLIQLAEYLVMHYGKDTTVTKVSVLVYQNFFEWLI